MVKILFCKYLVQIFLLTFSKKLRVRRKKFLTSIGMELVLQVRYAFLSLFYAAFILLS